VAVDIRFTNAVVTATRRLAIDFQPDGGRIPMRGRDGQGPRMGIERLWVLTGSPETVGTVGFLCVGVRDGGGRKL
jgi:hypothetical protein